MGLFSRWHIFDSLEKGEIKLNIPELAGGNVLLIVGAILLGYGLAWLQLADFARGTALSIGGGVMLFVGILLSIHTFIQVANSLKNTIMSVKKATEYVEEVEKKTFGSSASNYHSSNSLHKHVEELEKKVKQSMGQSF